MAPQPPPVVRLVASAKALTPVTLAPFPMAIPPGSPEALASTIPPLAAKEYLFNAFDSIPSAMEASPAAILLCPIEIEEFPLATTLYVEVNSWVPMASELNPVASAPLPIAVDDIPLAVVLLPIANEYCPLAVVFCTGGLPKTLYELLPMAMAPSAPALAP